MVHSLIHIHARGSPAGGPRAVNLGEGIDDTAVPYKVRFALGDETQQEEVLGNLVVIRAGQMRHVLNEGDLQFGVQPVSSHPPDQVVNVGDKDSGGGGIRRTRVGMYPVQEYTARHPLPCHHAPV